eukprot:Plantae.Rhodophyta-Purpureofilum_apyrenoidigerum.ctg14323.p1 GENE.Plantae.Rhodophyta-Purpureofilum_apyrenoidigerum.ctg14323~~Plantae.Rhodophyta-Purpureofilum_apyrenoidigerum.ctg14323.p1  ORF type:complete len:254 (-),score=42.78 Plantae.Rhodophyta-Purpureofilum_apyrenoidigerum.ctg14323:499-1260(-)
MDLSLDVRIRNWVFIPIAVATFLAGIVLQYVSMMFKRQPRVQQYKVKEASAIMRLRALQKNYKMLPPEQLAMRKQFFLDAENGFLNRPRESKGFLDMFMDPEYMAGRVVEIVTTFGPQMAIGAWVRYMFGGFAVCKVPFPLPPRFRTMLQSGIEFTSRDLDVRYVSALSWYVLNLFGHYGSYKLLLASPNVVPPAVGGTATTLSSAIDTQFEMNWAKFVKNCQGTLAAVKTDWKVPDAEDELLELAVKADPVP